MSYLRRYTPPATVVIAIACLYLFDLAGVGVLPPDEPRYLAIGRSMAHTGDWITPRLWGFAWFEKPPLLYWMTAAGAALHLGPEMSGRLPVALLSLAFLAVMFVLLRPEFGTEAAAVAAIALATSAFWFNFSSFGLTDLPLAVFFSLAVFVALPLLESAPSLRPDRLGRFFLIGALLGVATLAKGLVPLALAAPFAWFLRRWWRSWPIAFGALVLTAAPWYLTVYLRNGRAFLEEFFWKHHFERLYSPSLLHVQPWWYYLPVLLVALFPWTPLFGLLLRRRNFWDVRKRFLGTTVAFGVFLFSLSLNKLPGYLLPVLPAAFALLGASFCGDTLAYPARRWLLPSALIIGLMPLGTRWLPEVVAMGRIVSPRDVHVGATGIFYMTAPLAVVLLARRSWVPMLLVLCFVAGGFYLKITAYPVLDRAVSARGTWRWLRQTRGSICDDWLARNWEYGLAFYRGEPYPVCGTDRYDFALRSHDRNMPVLVPK